MKQLLGATAICALLANPLFAGSLSDPQVEPDLVIAEAENDSGKEDALIVTLWLATLMAALGGAF